MEPHDEGDEAASWEAIADPHPESRVVGFVQRSAGAAEQAEVPQPAVTVVLVLSGSMRLGNDERSVRAAVVGLRDAPLWSRWSGPVECLEVRLSPLDMYAVLGGRPMNEITGDVIGLEDLLGSDASQLLERVRSANGWTERFDLVRVLSAQARSTHQVSAEVREAWSILSATAGRVGVAELCSATGWSAKRLRARFRREIGVTPKQAARLIRFGVAYQRLSAGVAPSVVAAEGGFADQSHLHRNVVSFSGTTPGMLPR